MEILEFRFTSQPARQGVDAKLCGVVGSGNLEILIQPGDDARACLVAVKTSARGFGQIWEAVIAEFANRHAVGGTRIAIHDMGATPAVVSLRLGQALCEYIGGVP